MSTMPSWEEVMLRMNQFVTQRDGEWCGIPMPLEGLGLVLESRHPQAKRIEELQRIIDRKDVREVTVRACTDDAMGWTIVNRWWGRTPKGLTGTIQMLRHEDGRTAWGIEPDLTKRNKFWLGPLETLDAWSLETELTAIDKLAGLLTERMFKAYVLTGTFLETSKRSGLTYFFRRLRPTLVLTPHRDPVELKLLCALCLHPLAYYAESFCGAMTPTDDVIAHLLLMRGDEHLYWRRSNQHPLHAPEAGL